tara:strand:- start:371 stop:562 length:192 start_codon:yes stop_codon:yes gene_type:complete
MIDPLTMIFTLCVELMKYFSLISGLSYKEINVLVFLVIQPLLISVFFILWRKERSYGIKANTS